MTGLIGRPCWSIAAITLSVAFLVCLLASASTASPINFTVDASKPTTLWPHYWKECVGSGHALLALRQDYREHLTMARRDLGLKYVRFHAMFDDDMSTLLEFDSNGKAVYSFFNLNSIYDFLLSIGMKPYVELSFMPGPLASNSTYVMRYLGNTSPPKDYNQWSDLVSAYLRQIIERYGIYEVRTWYFELWNEPDSMWSGTQAEYFKLYNYTSRAIKAVDPLLRVGGPATAQSLWIPQFKSYVLANQLPLDFISTHEYPTDVRPLQRDIMKKVITKTKLEASPYPVIYSEYNSGLFNPVGKHDDPYASAFIMYTIPELQGVIDILSYWAFSDIFEESGFDSTPFHQGYGMLNINKIPKPAYRAFELLHRTGQERLVVSDPRHPTVGTFAILNKEAREVIIIAYNFQIPDHPIQTQVVSISVTGLPLSGGEYATLERIDESNANAKAAWRALGRPQYPDREQLLLLQRASQLEKERINFSSNSSGITFEPFYLPALGVAAITLHY